MAILPMLLAGILDPDLVLVLVLVYPDIFRQVVIWNVSLGL